MTRFERKSSSSVRRSRVDSSDQEDPSAPRKSPGATDSKPSTAATSRVAAEGAGRPGSDGLARRFLAIVVWLVTAFFSLILSFLQIIILTILSIALVGVISYVAIKAYVHTPEVEVPNVIGMTVEEALVRLKDARLSLLLEREEYSDLVESGEILSQMPAPEATVRAGSPLKVVISRGMRLLPVPDVRGENYLNAGITLRAMDLQEGNRTYFHDPDFKKDTIVAQDPPPQSGVLRNTRVNLLISLGPKEHLVTMPSLLGMTSEEAQDHLEELGLRLAEIEIIIHPTTRPGLVFDQEPTPGTVVDEFDEITVSVAKIPATAFPGQLY